MRALLAFVSAVLLICLILLALQFHKQHAPMSADSRPFVPPISQRLPPGADQTPTAIYAHNLILRRGPDFRVYVRWLRGSMARAHKNTNPSFDDPESFFLDIKTGVVHANIGDLSNFINKNALSNSPLKNISLSGDGEQIKLKATLHKVLPLPVELDGNLSVAPENQIRVHITKLDVLKIPAKALLGTFHIQAADLFHSGTIPGVRVEGNDLYFDTQQLFPPPHIRGELTRVRIVNPDLEEIYGNGQDDVDRVEQWRNFLRLRDGTIDFGKLTMHDVDLIMIDISQEPWFDLDLALYQEQLVNGYTRITPEAGLQVFMPDVDEIPHNKANQSVGIQWMKNRNLPPPVDVAPPAALTQFKGKR
jgi:hypothetical protein